MPQLTLSLGGTDFCLIPADGADSGSVRFSASPTNDGAVFLDLQSFTGQLRVVLSNGSASPHHAPPNAAKVTPRLAASAGPKRPLEEDHDDEPYDFMASQDLLESPTSTTTDTPNKKQRIDRKEEEESVVEEEERPNSLSVEDEEEQDDVPTDCSQTQATLLAQMDFSQTQPTSDDPFKLSQEGEESSNQSLFDKQPVVTKSNVEKILAAESRPTSPAPQTTTSSEEDATTGQEEPKTMPNETIVKEDTPVPVTKEPEVVIKEAVVSESVKPKATKDEPTQVKSTPRVSLDGSPEKDIAPRLQQPPPSARWGHTVTSIDNNKFVVYGGQGYHPESSLPHTLNDLHVYDMKKEIWFKPFSGDGLPRQWHSSTYLPDRQLLLAFGGESMHPKTGKVRTHSNVMVCDVELMVWYPATVSGEVPSGRSGHAAAMMGHDLVVFGGVKGSKWLNTVSVLNTQNWIWRSIKIQGSAPKPRSYHSATTVGANRMVVFGGNDAKESFASVHVLEKTESNTWEWTHPMVTGYGPSGRTGHSATLLPDGRTICIYGGWDPNDDEGAASSNDETLIFNDAFLLNTETWQWQKVAVSPAKRVGHEAILATQGGETRVVAFGGRIPQDRFTDALETFNIPQQE
jgi:N-acetylneuraminic acid mutarotase